MYDLTFSNKLKEIPMLISGALVRIDPSCKVLFLANSVCISLHALCSVSPQLYETPVFLGFLSPHCQSEMSIQAARGENCRTHCRRSPFSGNTFCASFNLLSMNSFHIFFPVFQLFTVERLIQSLLIHHGPKQKFSFFMNILDVFSYILR